MHDTFLTPLVDATRPKAQKTVANGTSPYKSGPGTKLFSGVIALAFLGLSFQSFAQTSVIDATPTRESKAARSGYEPEMVLIESGSFIMGCDDQKETVCQDFEKPTHKVNIPKFYLAKTEVTVAQFRAFVEDKNYKTTAEQQESCFSPDDSDNLDNVEGKGNSWKKLGYDQGDSHPVACVSHEDAKAYVAWLSDKTGRTWRLPSEAEWEYAARAGTNTEYSWGSEIGVNKANCWADGCGDSFKATSPVKSFSENQFGLYDMNGNVWEWVEDKWHENYKGAPADGAAWMSGESDYRVLRGGSWHDNSQGLGLRSAYRNFLMPTYRFNFIGFRPAQNYSK